ncbi:MAG: hypothetical protein C4312_04160 [Thermoflexus sp.]
MAALLLRGGLRCGARRAGPHSDPGVLAGVYAGLEAQAVIVGVHTHLEIWSPSAWEEILERFQNGRIPPEHWAGLQI